MNETTEGRLVHVIETSRGNSIFREPNGIGGHRYWSDAIGGGVMLWDTSLVSIEDLERAISVERRLQEEAP